MLHSAQWYNISSFCRGYSVGAVTVLTGVGTHPCGAEWFFRCSTPPLVTTYDARETFHSFWCVQFILYTAPVPDKIHAYGHSQAFRCPYATRTGPVRDQWTHLACTWVPYIGPERAISIILTQLKIEMVNSEYASSGCLYLKRHVYGLAPAPTAPLQYVNYWRPLQVTHAGPGACLCRPGAGLLWSPLIYMVKKYEAVSMGVGPVAWCGRRRSKHPR